MNIGHYRVGGIGILTEQPENHSLNRSWTLVYALSRAGMYLMGDRLRSLDEGDILFFPPKVSFSFRSDDLNGEYNENIDAVVLQFDEGWLDALLTVFGNCSDIVLSLKGQKAARYVTGAKWMKMSSLLKELSSCSPARQAVHLLDILMLLSSEKDMEPIALPAGTAENAPGPVTAEERMERIERYVSCNLLKKMSLEGVAAYSGMNRTYFCLFFRKHYGMGFTDYVNTLRVDRASDLLAATDRSLTDIAAGCGFASVPYFNRIFKKIKGVTPGQFRHLCSGSSR